MAEITVVSVSFGHSKSQIDRHINDWLCQTYQDWELWIVHDGPNEEVKEWVDAYKEKRVLYKNSKERHGNYGHNNRRDFCKLVETPYVHITNADNQYMPLFLEILMREIKERNLDMILTWIAHNYPGVQPENREPEIPYNILRPHPSINRTDFCNFIVKTDLVNKTGWNHIEFTGQDGMLAQEIVAWHIAKWWVYPGILAVHN